MHGTGSTSVLINLFTRVASLGAGWVMYILVFLSVLSIAIMLERARYYWVLRENLEWLAEKLTAFLRSGDTEQARKLLTESPSPAAKVALAGLDEAERGPESAEEAMA